MSVLIGVSGMLVLAAVYVGLALGDRGRSGCGGCALRELEKACDACTRNAADAERRATATGSRPGEPEEPISSGWTEDDTPGWIDDTDERWKP